MIPQVGALLGGCGLEMDFRLQPQDADIRFLFPVLVSVFDPTHSSVFTTVFDCYHAGKRAAS